MDDIETYTETAIENAAIALLWQASDATEDGNGFPISDDEYGQLYGETQFVARVVAEVPYIAEAVTAFVAANADVLTRAGVTAEQCGHDIILTANGCGAGFWDRGLDMPAGDGTTQTAGDYLTQATRRYSFDAEFALDEDGDVTWLMVENTVLVDELGWASDPDAS